MQAVISRDRHALGLGQRARCCRAGGASRSTMPVGIARADRDLVHVHVGRVQQTAALPTIARTASAFGIALAQIVVPSSGSTRDVDLAAVARCRPPRRCRASAPRPSRLRRSRPCRGCERVPSSRRMASTAALSAAFSLPRPRQRAAAIAAASVTRATSSTSTRSRPSVVSARLPWLTYSFLARACVRRSKLLDADHLRPLGDLAVLLDRARAPCGSPASVVSCVIRSRAA